MFCLQGKQQCFVCRRGVLICVKSHFRLNGTELGLFYFFLVKPLSRNFIVFVLLSQIIKFFKLKYTVSGSKNEKCQCQICPSLRMGRLKRIHRYERDPKFSSGSKLSDLYHIFKREREKERDITKQISMFCIS